MALLIPTTRCRTIFRASDERYQKALLYIKLNSLNKEEEEIAKQMIKDSLDLFHLPGDWFTYTNASTHEIEIFDSFLVVVRQYRFPPVNKQEINRQINELIENNVN